MRRSERQRTLLLLLILIVGYLSYISFRYEAYTFTWADPGWQVSVAQSILEDGDLDIKNQLNGDPSRASSQVAIGRGGQWYNVHEYLLPVASAWVLKIAGLNGLLLFNVAVTVALQFFTYLICVSHVGPRIAFWTTLLNAFATLFLPYSYSYSMDVLAVMLLVISFWAVGNGKFALGGVFAGLAVLGRLTNVVALPWLLLLSFFLAKKGEKQTAMLRFVAGGLPLAVVFCLANWQMYGDMFSVGYMHWAKTIDSQLVVVDQTSLFSGPTWENLRGNLFHPRKGLLVSMLLLPVALIFGLREFLSKRTPEAFVYLGISFSFVIFFSSFSAWIHTTSGNRYLMPVVALSALPLAYAIQKLFPALGAKKERV